MVLVKVKKPKAVLFDISGTVARESFVEKNLLPYFKTAYKTYIETNWGKPECTNSIKQLSEQAAKNGGPKIDPNADKNTVINQIGQYIEFCSKQEKENKAFAVFRFNVWFDGYERGKVTTPVYSDVAVTIQRWKCNQNIKLFVLSNGWSEASKKFMSKTSHGDLNLVIDGHFDTSMGPLTQPETYKKVCDAIKEQPAEVVFLTKSPEEAQAAKQAGLNVVLVLTHSAAVDAAAATCKDIPIARTFTDIEFT